MTKLYSPGQKSRAICEDCGKRVTTTFGYHHVPFSDGKGAAPNVLAATCDDCGDVVAVPAQSTPAIIRARQRAEISLEISLPAHEMDILDAAVHTIDSQATVNFRKTIVIYYIGVLGEQGETADRLKNGVGAWIAESRAERKRARQHNVSIPTRRLSMKIASRTKDLLERVMAKSGLTKTEIVRGIVMLAKHDVLEVKEVETSKTVKDLRVIASAMSG